MEKKYYGLIITLAVVVVIAVSGFIYMNDNEYYNDYKLQENCTNNALELSVTAMTPLIPQMIGSSDSLSKITNTNDTSNNNTALNGALNNATMAQEYQQKMLKNAKTDTEKNYAKTLIEQSKAFIDYLNIIKVLEVNTNETNKTTELMNRLDELSNQTQNYQNDLDAIKNNDTNFKNRLNKEDNKDNN
ncbi:MAG: hypothetical protein WCF28_05575 [Methanobacterium sp.]|uniref:hypothetical protein n=1 Tax=Methanobacterium sp. TaxID=2164 RepID=UPI003C78B829